MGQTIEVEFDDARYAALEKEAARLGLSVTQVVARATTVWLQESDDNVAVVGCAASGDCD